MSELKNDGEVRLIAGRYKARRLRFPAAPGLRPSGDRIRETVFSWLLPWLPESRVLDLFAGSGALGFEAASRGASSVLMNELNGKVAAALRDNKKLLQADQVIISQKDAMALLAEIDGPFDIIFLDPPFHADWLARVLQVIAQRELLAIDGVVYVEQERAAEAPELPPQWYWHRNKETGQVRYALARRNLE